MPKPLHLLGRRRTNPARFVALGFAIAVAAGTAMLMLPVSRSEVQADASDPAVLTQLGVRNIDTAVVAIGAGLEASVLVTAALVDLGVPRVWAKANGEQHRTILERMGAHRVFLPEHEMGERVAHMLTGTTLEYLSLDAGFALAEVVAPSSVVGRSLGDLGLRAKHGVTVVCIKQPGGAFTYAEAGTRVEAGALLMIAGTPADIDGFLGVS